MMQTLDTYGYEESVLLKPKNYQVTISSEDHIITVENDGALLARLGLELVDSTLFLKGYDNVTIAQVDIPLSTGIDSISYNKQTHVITFIITRIDGSKETYDIDISDLVDLYQEGNGIEISEDGEGKKTINVKINEDNRDILSADENGLAINLSGYAKSLDIEEINKAIKAVDDKIAVEDEKLNVEISRAMSAETSLSEEIETEKTRAMGMEVSINQTVAALKTDVNNKANMSDVPTKVSQLENDVNYITSGQVSDIYATKESLDFISGQSNSALSISQQCEEDVKAFSGNIKSISATTEEYIDITHQLDDIVTDYVFITRELSATTADLVESAKTHLSKEEFNSYSAECKSFQDIISAKTDNIESTFNQNLGNEIIRATEAESKLRDDFTNFDKEILSLLEGKVSKVDGKDLSDNNFSDDYKEKLDNLDNNLETLFNNDRLLSSQISFVSGSVNSKVEVSTYDEKMAQIDQKVANIESSAASKSDVESISAKSDSAIELATKNDELVQNLNEKVKSVSARTEEYVDITNQLDDIVTDYVFMTRALSSTTEDLKNSVATKITEEQSRNFTTEIVDSKLVNYTQTTGISSMIEESVATAKTAAVTESKSYTDGQVTSLKNVVDEEIFSAKTSVNSAIAKNSNELHVLSVCNDGSSYDITKAMTLQGTGVVDETYRLLHKLLANIDENDLSALNTKLKELIGK